MALNCDFEGIDNDLLVTDPKTSQILAKPPAPSFQNGADKRKPLDGFTRSQYSIFTRNLEQCSQFGEQSRDIGGGGIKLPKKTREAARNRTPDQCCIPRFKKEQQFKAKNNKFVDPSRLSS